MVAMLMVLIYNLADTFFIGLTKDAYQVAAVSMATLVFLIFMEDIRVIMGTSADTYEFAKSYLTIVTFSGPFVLLFQCYSCRRSDRKGNDGTIVGQLFKYYRGSNFLKNVF